MKCFIYGTLVFIIAIFYFPCTTIAQKVDVLPDTAYVRLHENAIIYWYNGYPATFAKRNAITHVYRIFGVGIKWVPTAAQNDSIRKAMRQNAEKVETHIYQNYKGTEAGFNKLVNDYEELFGNIYKGLQVDNHYQRLEKNATIKGLQPDISFVPSERKVVYSKRYENLLEICVIFIDTLTNTRAPQQLFYDYNYKTKKVTFNFEYPLTKQE